MKIRDVNPYVLVSAKRANALQHGWRKPLPVRVRINGQPRAAWRINMMPAGDGSFYLYLSGTVRDASRTEVGDRVEVELSFDERYKGGPTQRLPPAFHRALRSSPKARSAWQSLPPSRKKEVARYIASLKSEEARMRNVEKAVRALGARSAYFMGRSWKGGK